MGTKLLIVDDEPFTVDMLETFLQINGFETVGALNGEDGLVLVKVEQPELVILDLMLPDIEGYEVCKRIRSYPDSATLPVLVLSARAETASKERAMAAGADAYLVKPVQFPQLLTELNRLLEQKKSTAAAQPTAQPEAPAPESFTAPSTPIPPAIPATPATPTTSPAQPTPSTPDSSPATPDTPPVQPTQPSGPTTSTTPQPQPPTTSAAPAAPTPSAQPTMPSPIPFQYSDPTAPNTPSPQTNGVERSQPTTPPPATPDNKPGASN